MIIVEYVLGFHVEQFLGVRIGSKDRDKIRYLSVGKGILKHAQSLMC